MRIALDSNVLISALSQNEHHSDEAQTLIRQVVSGKHHAVISSIAYGELLSLSLPGSKTVKTLDVGQFFASLTHVATISANDAVCRRAGELRIKYGAKLKLPDAIHLATALEAGVDVFITNDFALAGIAKKIIPTKTLADQL